MKLVFRKRQTNAAYACGEKLPLGLLLDYSAKGLGGCCFFVILDRAEYQYKNVGPRAVGPNGRPLEDRESSGGKPDHGQPSVARRRDMAVQPRIGMASASCGTMADGTAN